MSQRPATPREAARRTENAPLAEPPQPEAWLGRLRYIVVPVIAVVAITVAIYFLQESNTPATTDLGGANPITPIQLSGDLAKLPPPRIGQTAANFTLMGLDGKTVSLTDFRGKAVFLNFFATWCPPCRAEMPDIQALYDQYKDAGMVVLGLNMQEDLKVVQDYVNTAGLTFPIALDRRGDVTAVYRIMGIPTTFFIDKEGVIRDMQIGPMNRNTMKSKLQKAM